MSIREQPHHHKWQNRVHSWLVIPHSPLSHVNINRRVSLEELRKHTSKTDMWMAINGVVYDVTHFSPHHPGGVLLLQSYAGKDATTAFRNNHTQVDLLDVCLGAFRVGVLDNDRDINISSSSSSSRKGTLAPEDNNNNNNDAPPPYAAYYSKKKGENGDKGSVISQRTSGSSKVIDEHVKPSSISGVVRSSETARAAVKSMLFKGISEREINDMANKVFQNEQDKEISKLQKNKSEENTDLSINDNDDAESATKNCSPKSSSSHCNLNTEDETHESEIIAIFQMLDATNKGYVTFEAVIDFLINIEGCVDIQEGENMIKEHVSPAVFMKKSMNLDEYISFICSLK